MALYLSSPGVICCAGSGLGPLHDAVLAGKTWHRTGLALEALMDDALSQIKESAELAAARYGRDWVGVFVGSFAGS